MKEKTKKNQLILDIKSDQWNEKSTEETQNPKNYNFNFKTLIKKTIFESFITNFTLRLM